MAEEPLSILLVEDDMDLAGLLRTAMESEGYRVRWAANGQDALAALGGAQPDVLLLDLMLPDLDGLEVSARVRERCPSEPYLPILMLTALDTPSYKQLGFARGADDYITKPFDLVELLARVRVWGGASRRIRALHEAREQLEAERQVPQDQAMRHMALAIPDALNKSLSEVCSYAELLANRPGADPGAQDLCNRLRQAAGRLAATIDRLANAARDGTKGCSSNVEMLDLQPGAEEHLPPSAASSS